MEESACTTDRDFVNMAAEETTMRMNVDGERKRGIADPTSVHDRRLWSQEACDGLKVGKSTSSRADLLVLEEEEEVTLDHHSIKKKRLL